MRRYLAAVIAPLIVAVVMQLTWPLFKDFPTTLYLLAVVFCGWYGGLWPGVTSFVISVLIADYFFIQPFFSIGYASKSDSIRLVLLAVVGIFTSLLSEGLHRQTERARNNLQRWSRLAAIVESSEDAIIGKTLEGIITSWNNGAHKIYGYTAEEMVGRSIALLLPPGNQDEMQKIIGRIKAGEVIEHYETNRITKDGRLIKVSLTASAVHDADGILSGVSVIARDITEKYLTSELLAQGQTLLAEAQRLASVGSWNLDIQTNTHTWSDELYRIYGLRPGEASASTETFLKCVHPDDRITARQAIAQAHRAGGSIDVSLRIIRPFGDERILQSRLHTVVDGDGVPIRMHGTMQDVTERTTSAAAVAEAERKYREIFENAGEGIFQTTPGGQYLMANPAMAQMLGFASPEELLRTRKDITNETYVDPARRSEFQRVLEAEGSTHEFEAEIFRKDGSRIWVSVNARAIRNQSREIAYYEGTAQDISERKRAQAALLESQELFSKAFYSSPAPLLITRVADGSVVGANGAFLRGFGYELEEVIGRSVRDLNIYLGQDDREKLLQELRQDGSLVQVESQARTKSGEILDLLVSVEPITLKGEQCLLSTAYDVTSRKRAEAESRASYQLLHTVVEEIPDAIFVKDLHGRYQLINSAGARVFGKSVEEIIGKEDNVLISGDTALEIMRRDREILTTGVSQTFEEMITAAGGTRTYLTSKSVRRDSEGSPSGLIGIARDITASKQAEEALREAEERYRSIFENASEGIFQTTPAGAYIAANPALAHIHGFSSAEQMISNRQNISQQVYVNPGQRDEFKRLMTKYGTVREFEHEIFRYDGSRTWISVNARAVRDQHGTILYYEGTTQDITKRKRAEEELLANEQRYRKLAQNFPNGTVITYDRNLRVTFIAGRGLPETGFPAAHYVGKLLAEIAPPEVVALVTPHFRAAFAGQTEIYECPFPDGRIYFAAVAPLFDSNGAANEILVISQNITEQARAKQKIEFQASLLQQVRNAVIATDLEGKIIFWNNFAEQLYQWTAGEVLGRSDLAVVVPEANKEASRSILELAKTSGHWEGEFVVRRKDGSAFPAYVHIAVIRDAKGEMVGYVGISTDITDRKRAEEEMRQSEERYRELFENARDAIYVHDLGGRYTSVNRAAEELLGFTRSEVVGRHYSNFVAPGDLKRVRTNLCRKLDHDRQTVYEVNIVNRAGQRIPIEVSSRLIFERGVAVGVQGTARDITERKRAQEALQIYSQRLIAAQEAERQKIARELHDEIGQVLTAIRINLQSIKRSRRSSEDSWPLKESIDIVDEALSRVRELSIELRPALLDDLGLCAALHWYVDRYAQRTGIIAEVLNGSDVDVRMPRDLETACFRIAQEALTNVARHAQAVSVSVQLERARNKMLLTVIDDGLGFDVVQLRKSAAASSALGLRGMEERALALGGHLVIDSRQALGTRIQAIFPLK